MKGRFAKLASALAGGALAAGLLGGCASTTPSGLRYGDVLRGSSEPEDVADKLTPPRGECLQQAQHFVNRPSDILDAPLSPDLSRGYAAVLRGLHPVAKQVLRRTHGVWLARDVPGAAARFIPCEDPDGAPSGLVLVDVNAYPLARETTDVEVPRLYWELVGVHTSSAPRRVARRPTVHEPDVTRDLAVRYVVLHELGHALSLMAGEFRLDSERTFRPGADPGFLSFSWREQGALVSTANDARSRGYVPLGLAFNDWREVRRALDAEPTVLAPGYRRTPSLEPLSACALAERLPAAGFVTPAAAVSPTEDYAELFAHAMLANEGKLNHGDRLELSHEDCGDVTIESPYFSPGVSAKRHYIERALGLLER